METLHLVIKHKWFDMIASGEKIEEYREMTNYWKKRIWNKRSVIGYVIFHRGYTNVTIKCFLHYVAIMPGYEKWGAEPGKTYYVLRISKYED